MTFAKTCMIGLATAAAVLATAGAPFAADPAGDPAAGKAIYQDICARCHTLEPGGRKIGPSLYGVVGRTPGTLPGFPYSKAMKAFGQSGAVWDAASLDTFLAAPGEVVEDTRMTFRGLKKAEDRADIIAYLRQVAEEE